MAEWYKEKNMVFRLSTLDVNTDFSIWKAWDKRSEEIKDKDGNVMKFPIKQGQLTDIDGKVYEVADIKFIPNKDFKEKFPNLSRNFRFIRNVIIDKKEYAYGFTKTSNSKILELLDMAKMSKQDPLSCEFKQEFNNDKSPAEKYSLKITKMGLPKEEVEKSEDGNGREKEIMEAIKSVHQDSADETRFVEIMKQNGITEERAKVIYKEQYKK